MKSSYWLSICAVGALVGGFEIGGCSSDSGLPSDGGMKDGPMNTAGGSTGSQGGQTGSQGGNTGAGGSTETQPATSAPVYTGPPVSTNTGNGTGTDTFGGGTGTNTFGGGTGTRTRTRTATGTNTFGGGTGTVTESATDTETDTSTDTTTG